MQTNKVLSIAVPTYNRPGKLIRLLGIVKQQLIDSLLFHKVNVIVSDNSDNDETAKLFAHFEAGEIDIIYHKQEKNLGFDNNIRFLYREATGNHVWFMSDDDHPINGSLQKIVSLLEAQAPDVLLFSFVQPPGSTIRQFNYTEEVHKVTTPEEAIRNIIKMPKISIFVLRRLSFSKELELTHADAIGDGWMFLILSLSVLYTSGNLSMMIFSEHLASCDEDFRHIWVPAPFLRLYKVGEHPYVKKNLPSLKNELLEEGYRQSILFSWALVRGKLLMDDPEGLKKFIRKDLGWKMPVLLRQPKLLLMLFLMKTGLTPSFLKDQPQL